MFFYSIAAMDAHLLGEDLQAAVEGLSLLPPSIPSNPIVDETIHDYAEIYTPSRERVPWLSAGNGRREVSQGTDCNIMLVLGQNKSDEEFQFLVYMKALYQFTEILSDYIFIT